MPEGHTIYRLARDLTRDFAGKIVSASSPQLRFADGAKKVDRRTFKGASGLGKHLLLSIGDCIVHVHLGLFGKMRRHASPPPPPRPTVRLRLIGPAWTWDLIGANICEIADEEILAKLRARIGGDLLADDVSAAAVWKKVHASRRTIGALLLDQRVFAGVGNVYRAELLFLTRLHPETQGDELARKDVNALVRHGKALLRVGVDTNRILVVKGSTSRSKRADALYVYKQPICKKCGASIRAMKSGNRTVYYCPACQAPRPVPHT